MGSQSGDHAKERDAEYEKMGGSRLLKPAQFVRMSLTMRIDLGSETFRCGVGTGIRFNSLDR